MGAGQVVLGAEIEVVVVGVVEHGIDRGDRRHTDRPRRQARIFISIVRGIDGQVGMQDAFDREIADSELDRRIGLQRHTALQPVDINPRHDGHFVLALGLLVNDRSEGHRPVAGEARAGEFRIAVFPEPVGLFLHSPNKIIRRTVPIHFVSIRNEHPDEGLRRVSVCAGRRIAQQRPRKRRRIGFQPPADAAGQPVERPDIVESNPHRSLKPLFQSVDQRGVGHPRVELVTSRTNGLVQTAYTRYPHEFAYVAQRAAAPQRIGQPVEIAAGRNQHDRVAGHRPAPKVLPCGITTDTNRYRKRRKRGKQVILSFSLHPEKYFCKYSEIV